MTYYASMMAVGVVCVAALILFYPTRQGLSDKDSVVISFEKGVISAEIASSTLKKYQGLSGRETLQKDTGMLFVFLQPSYLSFVMRDMKFNLDFVWIDNNVVVDISKNISAPQNGEAPIHIKPTNPASMVLEVNAGTIERLDIKVGEKISIQKQ